MLDQAAVLERRRQILRVVLLVIVFGTLPFYCLGFLLLATAPDSSPRVEDLPSATNTAFGAGGQIVTPTSFPTLSTTFNAPSTLPPTPIQYFPPATIILPPTATQFIFIPSSTFAPTLTFPPPNTPIPLPSDTPFVPPTNTNVPPLPTNTDVPPLPTNTEVPPLPTNTDAPPPDVILPPTDTPMP